jgi:hypothetical protein
MPIWHALGLQDTLFAQKSSPKRKFVVPRRLVWYASSSHPNQVPLIQVLKTNLKRKKMQFVQVERRQRLAVNNEGVTDRMK